MELHDLISSNQLNFTEHPIDAPDSFFPEIRMNKKAKFKVDSTSLGCYVNPGFLANECILENQMNHSKETCFNDFTIEESIEGTSRYRTISFEKKDNEPLGLTIKNDKNDSVIISRVIKNGLAIQFGLNEGDEIVQINSIDIKGRNINEISDALAKTTGKLVFVIAIRTKENFALRSTEPLELRALFDYNPDEDPYLPCKEIGIQFRKGDILHVVDQTDPNWWQATLDVNGNCLAGLIPSNQFQVMRTSCETNANDKKTGLNIFCGRKKKKQRNRLPKISLVYEKVMLYPPNKGAKRPIVLIGPTNLGIFELRKMLIQNDERLAVAVPHTTRRKMLEEIDGYDYHFCTQSEFELQIKQNRFIEYGKYAQNYYGLSIDSILAVIRSSKICLLNVNPATIEKLRNDQIALTIRPYFIFISASTDQIDDFHEINYLRVVEESMQIQALYGQYFDAKIVRTSLEETYARLVDEINSVETRSKYVPCSWMNYHNF